MAGVDPKATHDLVITDKFGVTKNYRVNAKFDPQSAIAQIDFTGLVGRIELYCSVNTSDLERPSIYIP